MYKSNLKTNLLCIVFYVIICLFIYRPVAYGQVLNANCNLRSNYKDFPLIEMNVAYHFVADANGNNFQCTDPQGAYYVPDVMEPVFNQANDYFSDPRVNEFGSAGKVADARFRWPDNFDCSNAYFYPNGIDIGEDIPTIPGFFNIIFGAFFMEKKSADPSGVIGV